MKNKSFGLLNFLFLLFTLFASYSVLAEEALEGSATETRNILLLPATFEMYELGAVSVEKVPEWTETATAMARTSLAKYLPEQHNFNLVDMPELSQAEDDLVTEHVLLYDYVAGEAISMINYGGAAWQHKKTDFDYSIGSGLDFLRAKTNADLALIYVGSDTVSTGGRVAMSVLFAVGGIGVPMTGPEIAVAGIIDLRTGAVDWINYKVGFMATDPRVDEGSTKIVELVFDQYPDSRLLGKKNKD